MISWRPDRRVATSGKSAGSSRPESDFGRRLVNCHPGRDLTSIRRGHQPRGIWRKRRGPAVTGLAAVGDDSAAQPSLAHESAACATRSEARLPTSAVQVMWVKPRSNPTGPAPTAGDRRPRPTAAIQKPMAPGGSRRGRVGDHAHHIVVRVGDREDHCAAVVQSGRNDALHVLPGVGRRVGAGTV